MVTKCPLLLDRQFHSVSYTHLDVYKRQDWFSFEEKAYVRSVRTSENIDAVRAAILRSPRRSVRKIASSLQLGRRSVQRILHELQFHPYKLQIVQQLNPKTTTIVG